MTAIPGIGATTGPQLYGFLFNYALLGALCVQVYHYHLEFPNDRPAIRTIVYTLLFLEVSQSILMSYDAYAIFGEGYGDLVALDTNHTDWFTVCILGSIVAGVVQGFYAHRLWTLSQSKITAGIVSLLALTQVVAGIIQGIFSKIVGNFSQLQKKSPIALGIWIGSGALCDILIAIGMVYYLKKSRTAFSKTNAVITKLVRFSIETGLVTAVLAVVLIILFLSTPGHDYFETPAKGLAKLYSNNLLVLLNSRSRIRAGSSGIVYDIESNRINEIRLDTVRSASEDPTVNGSDAMVPYNSTVTNGVRVHKETWKDAL